MRIAGGSLPAARGSASVAVNRKRWSSRLDRASGGTIALAADRQGGRQEVVYFVCGKAKNINQFNEQARIDSSKVLE
jgi:hypothetical protein